MTEQQDHDQESEGGSSPNREAARYRRQLRETEQKLAVATERLHTVERRQAEQIAAAKLHIGADLFDLGGVELDQLRNDEGDLDEEKITAAASALLDQRPGLAVPPKVADWDSGARMSNAAPAGDYSRVLRGH